MRPPLSQNAPARAPAQLASRGRIASTNRMHTYTDPTDARLRDILRQTRTIAVLGAHDDPQRPACFVPTYLREHGYRVLPVNPRLAGKPLFEQTVVADLRELSEPVDLLDVFRRPEALEGHLDEILGMSPPPRVVWLQEGVRHDAFAERLLHAGIEVVQDHCAKAEHQRLMESAAR